jgi:flavin-binding protein dodecin
MGSVYKVIEIVGTSTNSWEEAAQTAIATAGSKLRDLRVAEVIRQDVTVGEDGMPDEFRVRLSVSFKYEAE